MYISQTYIDEAILGKFTLGLKNLSKKKQLKNRLKDELERAKDSYELSKKFGSKRQAQIFGDHLKLMKDKYKETLKNFKPSYA